MEHVFEIARSGNGYLAIEQSSPIIRKMKKDNQLTEAMAFLMDLATVLAEAKQFDSATNCALRSIRMFPISSQTIRVYLKKKFVDFILSSTPEYNYPDFYTYTSTLISIIDDPDCSLRKKVLEVAQATNNFVQTEYLLVQLILILIKRNPVDYELVNTYLKTLANTLWIWVFNIDLPPTHDRREQRLYNAQILFVRSAFAFLTVKENGSEIAKQYLEYIKRTALSSILDDFYESPPFHFLKFYIKAIDSQSLETIKFLEDKYQQLIKKDKELEKLVDFVKEQHFPNNFNGGFGSIFQSVMNILGGSPM